MGDNYYDPVRGFQHGTYAGQRAPQPNLSYRDADQAGPAPPVGPPPNATALSPEDEKAYKVWRGMLPKELQYEGDYDLRGFFKANPGFTAESGQHMTDQFKQPNHPTFSDESQYYMPSNARLGGHWQGDMFVPNDEAFKSPKDESQASMMDAKSSASARKRRKRAVP